jgi:hypothetical protein
MWGAVGQSGGVREGFAGLVFLLATLRGRFIHGRAQLVPMQEVGPETGLVCYLAVYR